MNDQQKTQIRGRLSQRIRGATEARSRAYDEIQRRVREDTAAADEDFDIEVKKAWAEYDELMGAEK